MVKDGTNRGGRRVRAGAKPGPLGEKLAAGRPATRLEDPLNEPFDFAGNDIGDGAVRAGYSPLGILIYVWTRRQSSDINAWVTTSLEARGGDSSAFALQGASDQGTVYGYATAETPERLPLPLVLAHRTCERLDTAQVEGTICGINPDGKVQVSVRYDDTGTPAAVETVGSRCSMRRARIWPCCSVRCAR